MATHNGPESRLAQYLAKISGENVPTPKPSTEAEIYLNKIAENGGGSGGGAGVFWVNITSTDGGTTWTADKTADEVLAAAEGGQMVYALVDGESYVPLESGYAEDGYTSLTFASVSPGDYDSSAKRLLINTTKIDYSAEGTTTNLAVEIGSYTFSVSKIG